jgi:hypothetical protein
MILVGLENCNCCTVLHNKHPEVPYVVVPRDPAESNMDVFEVTKAISILGVAKYPVLLNDALNRVLPMSLINKDTR